MAKLHKKSASKRRKVLAERQARRAERFTDGFIRALDKLDRKDTDDLLRNLDRSELLDVVTASLREGEENAVKRFLAETDEQDDSVRTGV